jgi:putative ABC transport system ATP-binding protein
MSSESFIICDNLVKIYKVAQLEVVALQGLDLTVTRGELLGVVGASGSGKSTLMNIVGGLDRPTAGRVWVNNQDLLKMSDLALDQYRRSQVGFVWQQAARNLIPYLSAEENVELPMTLAGNVRKKRKHAQLLLETVGLTRRRRHALSQLSGGEQQRVAIAVALANGPKMILADEPTGEVDTETALTIYQAFRRLTTDLGVTTLIVSHDPGIARHVDRVVAIRDGKLAAETMRQAKAEKSDGDGQEATTEVEEEVFEELLVLDSAGRLQIPKHLLEQYGFQGRARLEVHEDGVLIRPAQRQGEERAAGAALDELTTRKNKGGVFGRLMRRSR